MSSKKDSRDRGSDPVPQVQKTFMPKAGACRSSPSPKTPVKASSSRVQAPGAASSRHPGTLLQRDNTPTSSPNNTKSGVLGTRLERDYPKPQLQSVLQSSRGPSKNQSPSAAPSAGAPSQSRSDLLGRTRVPSTIPIPSPSAYTYTKPFSSPQSSPGIRTQVIQLDRNQAHAEDERMREKERAKTREAEDALKRIEQCRAWAENDRREEARREDEALRQRGEEERRSEMDRQLARTRYAEDALARLRARDIQDARRLEDEHTRALEASEALERARERESTRVNGQSAQQLQHMMGNMTLQNLASQQGGQYQAFAQSSSASEIKISITEGLSMGPIYEVVSGTVLLANQGEVQIHNSRANATAERIMQISRERNEQQGAGLFGSRQEIQQANFTLQQSQMMATRHAHYNTMSVEDQHQHNMWIQWRLSLCGACPSGLRWNRDILGGFRCSGGDHFVHDQMLINGIPGCLVRVNRREVREIGATEIFAGPILDDMEADEAGDEWQLMKSGRISKSQYAAKWPCTTQM